MSPHDVREWLRARCDEALLAADAAPEAEHAYWTGRLNEAHDALRGFSERWPVREPSEVEWRLKQLRDCGYFVDKCFPPIPFVATGDDDAA